MQTFNVGISSALYRADGTQPFPDVDLAPLTRHPQISVTALPDVQTGLLENKDVRHLDAAILFLERITSATFGTDNHLTLLARYGVGYDTIDIPDCTAAGVAVAIAPSGVRRPVATTVVALLLALTLNLKTKDRLTRNSPTGWLDKTQHNGIGLVGRTLGGIGIGNIGAEVFRLIKPFDMRLIAHDPYADQAVARDAGIELVSLDEVFHQSDIVTVNCPLNESTFHLVNQQRLEMMKSTAYLINTSRGPVVDETALIAALKDGTIRGAGLDVFEQEPPDPANPLLTMDNVILSPHALCFTDQCLAGLGEADVNACLALMKGQIPEALVNPEVTDSALFNTRLKTYASRWG